MMIALNVQSDMAVTRPVSILIDVFEIMINSLFIICFTLHISLM